MSPTLDGQRLPRVELYVRSLAPRTGQDRVRQTVRRLDDLAAEGTVADVTVRVTGDAIPARPDDCATSYGASLAKQFGRFRDWATRTGRELGPGFDHRRVHSSYTGEDYDAVVPPALCLAEYRGGRLAFVAPSLASGTPVTVEQRLDALERGPGNERYDAATTRLDAQGTQRPVK